MKILPAIDILGGKAVRLRQGRFDDVTVYNDDPVDQARQWADQGAEWLHVVDLDGARSGEPENIDIIGRIVAAVDIPVQVGGGIRSMFTLKQLYAAGVSRTVIGTMLITNPELVTQACADYDGIVAGIDANAGKVAIKGWRQGTNHNVLDLIRELQFLGVKRVIYTDIARDGMQEGVNYGAYRALLRKTNMPIIASGGLGSLEDIRELLTLGIQIEGVIAGKALYEKKFTLQQAIMTGRGKEV